MCCCQKTQKRYCCQLSWRAWLGTAYACVLTSCMRFTIYETSTTVHIGTSQQENWVCGYGLFTQGRRKSWTEKTEKLKTEDWCRKEPRACSYNLKNGEGCLRGSACSKWFSLWKQVREYDLCRRMKKWEADRGKSVINDFSLLRFSAIMYTKKTKQNGLVIRRRK